MDIRGTGETLGFSAQLAAIYTELARCSGLFCRKRFDWSLTEYELLLTLWEAEDALSFAQLADFLILRTSTLWHMVPPLADRGLVTVQNDQKDRRLGRLQLSASGSHLVTECCESLFAFSKGVAQESLPDTEYDRFLRTGIGRNLDVLRGHPADFELKRLPEAAQGVEFTIFIRGILEKWRQCVQDQCQLTFNEFRVLHVLSDIPSLRVQDIAERLLAPRSQVSLSKRHLRKRGLVREFSNPFDGRSVLIALTPTGRRILEEVLPNLDAITVPTHHPGSEEGVMVLRAWHSRMYYNLKRHHGNIVESL